MLVVACRRWVVESFRFFWAPHGDSFGPIVCVVIVPQRYKLEIVRHRSWIIDTGWATRLRSMPVSNARMATQAKMLAVYEEILKCLEARAFKGPTPELRHGKLGKTLAV